MNKLSLGLVGLMSLVMVSSTGCPFYADRVEYRDAPPARSWTSQARFNSLYVNGNRFWGAEVRQGNPLTRARCTLHFTVKFYAPSYLYQRFQVKIWFRDGSWVRSPSFYNRIRGQRLYRFRIVTNSCWGAKKNTISRMRVVGCRYQGCSLPEL